MDRLRLFANIAICVCTGYSFVYGMLRSFGRDSPLFLKAIIGAMGCMMGGRLFAVVLQLCGGSSVSRMNLGYIGLTGCFQFIFSACHGEISERVRGSRNRVASLVSALAPVPVLILIRMILHTEVSVPYKILGSVVAVIVLCTAMYLFRYMILPDTGDGFLRMFRPCSVMLLVFSYSQLGEIYFAIRGNAVMLAVTYGLICIVGLTLVPLLERRVARWESR